MKKISQCRRLLVSGSIICAVLSGCSKFLDGQSAYNIENYTEAVRLFRQIPKEDENYVRAQTILKDIQDNKCSPSNVRASLAKFVRSWEYGFRNNAETWGSNIGTPSERAFHNAHRCQPGKFKEYIETTEKMIKEFLFEGSSICFEINPETNLRKRELQAEAIHALARLYADCTSSMTKNDADRAELSAALARLKPLDANVYNAIDMEVAAVTAEWKRLQPIIEAEEEAAQIIRESPEQYVANTSDMSQGTLTNAQKQKNRDAYRGKLVRSWTLQVLDFDGSIVSLSLPGSTLGFFAIVSKNVQTWGSSGSAAALHRGEIIVIKKATILPSGGLTTFEGVLLQ